jgi:hypothetical protein
MSEPCVSCGKTALHPFEGLVHSLLDGQRYYVRCSPPLQSLLGECTHCGWQITYRVIPEGCPRCSNPIRVVSGENAE